MIARNLFKRSIMVLILIVVLLIFSSTGSKVVIYKVKAQMENNIILSTQESIPSNQPVVIEFPPFKGDITKATKNKELKISDKQWHDAKSAFLKEHGPYPGMKYKP